MPPPTAGNEVPLPPSSVTEEPTALDRAIATRDASYLGTAPLACRMILDHKLNGLNEAISVAALGEAGPGGANDIYSIDLIGGAPSSCGSTTPIRFQRGPILENGFNGITNEALLAVVIDRMRGFQHGRNPDGTFDLNARGKFACRENAVALTHLEDALMWLQKRTRDRLARGVEGQNKL